MNVAVFGVGYVGLVQGAVLANVGHNVICVDVDSAKIESLGRGEIPIYEPGLEPLVRENHQVGRLHFTTDAKMAVEQSEVIFIAVGTPPDEDGSADLKHVLAVAETIAICMNGYKVVVNKSTVPVGTADKVDSAISATFASNGKKIPYDVVSNPEFLKEGAAVSDCMKPDRIVIGTTSAKAEALMRELYAPFNRHRERIFTMAPRSAELTKYAANCMLATKISFMNEMANLAEHLGADIEEVRHGIGSDPRIGYSFIYPGAGYGGSCFPKDIKALIHSAESVGYQSRILNSVEEVNDAQKQHLLALIDRHYPEGVEGKVFAIWGLAFKPQTNDIREATSRVVMNGLWERGAKVKAYDPEAMEEIARAYPDQEGLELCETKDAAVDGVDALVVCTEWKNFWAPDFGMLHRKLRDGVIFDGRNIYDPAKLDVLGLCYYGIGRGLSVIKQDAKSLRA